MGEATGITVKKNVNAKNFNIKHFKRRIIYFKSFKLPDIFSCQPDVLFSHLKSFDRDLFMRIRVNSKLSNVKILNLLYLNQFVNQISIVHTLFFLCEFGLL